MFLNRKKLKKTQKCLAGLICCLGLVFSLTVFSFAAQIDTSKTGSISFTLTCAGSAVSGGKITIYKAGEIDSAGTSLSFSLSDAFEGSGLSLDIDYDKAAQVEALAASLYAYTEENGISGTTVSVGSGGTVSVSGLSLGLYLVVQSEASEGCEAFSPFLVTLPMYDEAEGSYIYSVDASPKVSVEASEGETTPSDDDGDDGTEDGGTPEEESTPSGEEETTSPDGDGDDGTEDGDTPEEETTPSDEDGNDGTGDSDPDEEETTSSDGDGSSDDGNDGDSDSGDDGGSDDGSGAKTGDSARTALWGAAFVSAALILAAMALKKDITL